MPKFQSTAPAFSLRRYVESGAHHATAVQEIREHGLPAAIAHARTLGGVGPRCTGLARSMVALVGRVGDVPPKRLTPAQSFGRPVLMLEVPRLTWGFQGRRQVARLEWMPMHAFPVRR